MSEVTRLSATLGGAGIPLPVVEAAAGQLGFGVSVTPTAEPDTVAVTFGPVRGTLHDGCFLSLEPATDELEAAILHGLRELHSYYLQPRAAPATAFAAAQAFLKQDTTVRIQSSQGRVQVWAFPADASWLARRFSPRSTFAA